MDVVYAKYNRERLPRFQLSTLICTSDDGLIVKKTALTDEGINHIENIYNNYLLLKNNYENIGIAASELVGEEVIFEYVDGQSFEYSLLQAARERDRDAFFGILERYAGVLKDIGFTNYEKYSSCSGFDAVFGKHLELVNTDCFTVSNIDLSFENIIVSTDGKYKIIDYEWVFDFPMPVDYIIYRSVSLFFRHKDYLEDFISLTDVLGYFGIDQEQLIIFRELNEGITNYVYGSSALQQLLNNYLKKSDRLPDLLHNIQTEQQKISEFNNEQSERDRCLSEQEKYIHDCDQQLLERDQQIARLDMLLAEREQAVNDRDGRIDELLGSLSWKITSPFRWLGNFNTRGK